MICFVIIRHVNSSDTNKYWIECYTRIREFHKHNPILIVDSNSNYAFVTDIPTTNTMIIRSEFKGRGELQGYYYFYKTNIRNAAVVLQDSMFINRPVDFGSQNRFLWNFDIDNDNSGEINHMISFLKNNESLKNAYFNKTATKACFASCAVVTRETIGLLEERHNIFALLNVITTPQYAMGFERLFGVLLYTVDQNAGREPLFGNIFHYIDNEKGYSWVYSYNDYIRYRLHLSVPVIKVWTRRP